MSIFETGLLATIFFFSTKDWQSGKCSSGTFDLGKFFLDRTFPLNNYCLFIHVKTEKK